jgi:hypothetical protein
VKVIQDEGVGDQVKRRSKGELAPKLDGLDLEHQAEEGHQQERPCGENGAEVGPCAIGVQQLVSKGKLPTQQGAPLAKEDLMASRWTAAQ